MRWDALFADLEAELDAETEAERRSEVVDRIRSELGRLRLVDRLRPALETLGGNLRIRLTGHDLLSGSLQSLGADWLLLSQDSREELLVPLSAVQWISGLGRDSAEPGWEGAVGSRLALRVALRRIVRDRSMVVVGLTGGDTLTGRLAHVGADHVELEPADRADRAHQPHQTGPFGTTIPLHAIAFIRRAVAR